MATAYLTSAPPSDDHPASMSPADTAAHHAASYVRTVVVPEQDTPTPPTEPAARRRFIQQREW